MAVAVACAIGFFSEEKTPMQAVSYLQCWSNEEVLSAMSY